MAKFRAFIIIMAILILIASLVSPSFVALAGGTITITASGTNFALGHVGGADQELAQSFVAISTGTVTQLTITLAANTSSPTGTMTWLIDLDGAGSPGPNLASGTFSPVASSTNTITITGPTLTAGVIYWLHFKPTTNQTGTNAWNWQGQTSSTYAYGQPKFTTNAGSTWATYSGLEQQCSITITDATAVPSHTPPNTPVDTATAVPTVPTATILPSSTPGVPTATEKPNPTVVPDIDEPTSTEKPNPTGQPTSTPYIFVPVPTATEKPNPTGIPTSTPNNTPVDTPTEINTPVDTPTAIAFVDTPTPANTPVDTPTEINTPVDTPTEFVDDDSGFGGPSATPTDTLTPTITDTPTETPTPSDTPTPTPNLYGILTMEPSGQAGGILYLVSAGEAAIFAVLAFIISILLVLLFLAFRRSQA